MTDKIISKVYETTSYGKFKIMVGNRDIDKSRVAKIMESIEDVGYRMCPIVVNSKFEIVDGQGRFEALQVLGMPVKYVIDETADISVCRALNINQTNWGTRDYIKSYADKGNSDYDLLLKYVDAYKSLNLSVVMRVCSAADTVTVRGISFLKKIKNGEFKFMRPERDRQNELEYLCRFCDVFDNVGGCVEYYYTGILWAIRNTVVQKERLVSKVSDLRAYLPKVSDAKTALAQLTAVYNKGLHGDRVYIDQLYRENVTDATGREY